MVIYQLASAHYVSQALHVAAHLGIADLLAQGPQTPEALAAKARTHGGSLRRVLRLLASAGVFTEGANGRFELTPVGSALRGGLGSSRAVA
jgi:Dimerisation domain